MLLFCLFLQTIIPGMDSGVKSGGKTRRSNQKFSASPLYIDKDTHQCYKRSGGQGRPEQALIPTPVPCAYESMTMLSEVKFMDLRQADYEQDHALHIFLIRDRQIQFVPVLGCIMHSNAAEIYDYPVPAAFVGEKVKELFLRMDQRNLEFREEYKDYWLAPKGIRSWKKFEENALSIFIHCVDGKLHLFCCYPAAPRGFDSESQTPNVVFDRDVPAEELGNCILEQFAYIKEHPKTIR